MIKNYNDYWDLESYYQLIKKAEDDIRNYQPKKGERGRPVSRKVPDLDFNFGGYGEEYFEVPNRLLVIGRASGGYNELDSTILDSYKVISYNADAETDKGKWLFRDTNLKESIRKELDGHLKWLDFSSKENKRRSPYFNLVKKVEQALNGDKDEEWIHNIALINLFKFIPNGGGNPSVGLMRAQETAIFAELLRKQLNDFAPTHILLIVGQNNEYWYPKILKDEIEAYCKISGAKSAVVDRPEVRKQIAEEGTTNLQNIYHVIECGFGIDIR